MITAVYIYRFTLAARRDSGVVGQNLVQIHHSEDAVLEATDVANFGVLVSSGAVRKERLKVMTSKRTVKVIFQQDLQECLSIGMWQMLLRRNVDAIFVTPSNNNNKRNPVIASNI